ncbi:MAG TPA: hypothetical protein VMW04_04215 [Patescibacteria group bacterium]|nr:hypothetical protein [Patescibacteria group bacterium]
MAEEDDEVIAPKSSKLRWVYVSPESETPQRELIYDCWTTGDLDKATFHTQKRETSLKDIAFPSDFKIGNVVSGFDSAIKFLRWYEQIHDPDHTLEPYMYLFAGPAVRTLEEILSENIFRGLVAPSLRSFAHELNRSDEGDMTEMVALSKGEVKMPFVWTNRHQPFMYRRVCRFLKVFHSEIDPQSLPLSDILDKCKGLICMANQAFDLQTEGNYLRNLNDARGYGLQPHAAIWHDPWFDPRFVNGVLNEKLHIGDVLIGEGIGDMDYGAQELMMRYPYHGFDETYYFGVLDRNIQRTPIFYPPNMTNLYAVHFPRTLIEGPSIPNREEKKSEFVESDQLHGLLAIVFCDNPTRINPLAFTRVLDTKYGNGSWVVVKEESDGLKALNIKPKEQWRISSRPFKAIPLPKSY